MLRNKESTAVLLAIMVAIVALVILVSLTLIKVQALQEEVAKSTSSPSAIDVSGWQTYRNAAYGFEFEYPTSWTLYTEGLGGPTPFLALGNPLEGTSTYVMHIFIEQNPMQLSSGGYAHAVIDAAVAADKAAAKDGPAPQTAPRYAKSYILTVGPYTAYELYKVFEFDHNGERVYVAKGDHVLKFDFPVAEPNPNMYLPVANNQVAHAIMNTLVFTK